MNIEWATIWFLIAALVAGMMGEGPLLWAVMGSRLSRPTAGAQRFLPESGGSTSDLKEILMLARIGCGNWTCSTAE